MSVVAVRWALEQRQAGGARVVLIALAEAHNGRTGRCDPSQAGIAEQLGVTLRTVERAVSRLRTLGLVETTRRWHGKGGRTALSYALSIPSELSGESPDKTRRVTRQSRRSHPTEVSADIQLLTLKPEEKTIATVNGNGRARDEVWDELTTLFGDVPSKTNAHGRRNRAVADLKRFEATPVTIRRARQQWDAVYPGATCTDIALATHYAQLLRPQSSEDAAAWERKQELEAMNARYERT
jgi:hypothetical protein